MKRLLAALTRNWGLKLTALCLAIVVFYWVRGSIRRSQEGEGDKTPFPTKVPTHEAVPLR